MGYEQITHLRAHLERLVAEKATLQQRQQALLEKQHASEQDRNLLLSSLQEERKGINDLRHERLRLWEERHGMEREMTNIVQEAHFRVLKERAPQRYRGGVDPSFIALRRMHTLRTHLRKSQLLGRAYCQVVCVFQLLWTHPLLLPPPQAITSAQQQMDERNLRLASNGLALLEMPFSLVAALLTVAVLALDYLVLKRPVLLVLASLNGQGSYKTTAVAVIAQHDAVT